MRILPKAACVTDTGYVRRARFAPVTYAELNSIDLIRSVLPW